MQVNRKTKYNFVTGSGGLKPTIGINLMEKKDFPTVTHFLKCHIPVTNRSHFLVSDCLSKVEDIDKTVENLLLLRPRRCL